VILFFRFLKLIKNIISRPKIAITPTYHCPAISVDQWHILFISQVQNPTVYGALIGFIFAMRNPYFGRSVGSGYDDATSKSRCLFGLASHITNAMTSGQPMQKGLILHHLQHGSV
jgi:hypothetical protein